jgi:cysteinyl-tRNA synthetase
VPDRGAPLVLFNSLTRRAEEFRPLEPDTVRMYSCGPTVYAYPHIGNLRAYVVSDTVHRAFRWKGYDVRKVVNITDVGHLVADADEGDDKLETAARNSTESVFEIARHYENAFYADLDALRVLPAEVYCRATDHVEDMVEFAKVLQDKGFAYQLPTGLYLETALLPDYGRLASMRPDEQREGARVDAVTGKRGKNDFALWRTEADGQQRLMRWDSPWGWGAPGWHLECSVMSMRYLGDHFDVHTGGIDHRELHHVNEIAQSEAYLGDGEWVHWWLHNEFLNLRNAKMAKSTGTGLRLADLAEQGMEPAAYRMFLLGAHYRAQMDYSAAAVESAATTLRRLRQWLAPLGPLPELTTVAAATAAVTTDAGRDAVRRIDAAVSDDLNTAVVLAVLQGLRSEDLPAGDLAAVAGAVEQLLALGLDRPQERAAVPSDLAADIAALLALRDGARAERNWAEADRIRDELAGRGVQIKDTATGTEWEYVG